MTNKLHSLGDKYNGALTPEQARKLMEDNMKFQSGQEFNWKYTLTENQVSEAVKDYKAKHKAEFDAKMFAQLQNMTDGAVVKKPIANITEDYTHTNVYKNDKLCGSYPNTEYRGDRYNNVIGAEALRRQSEIQMFAESCAHNWQTHTTAERWTNESQP